MVYVALLRGINVGGNNKINMKLLQTSFERAGMSDVVTYINSGNIVFAHDGDDASRLPATLESVIAEDFGLTIRVVVRSIEEYALVMDALPPTWVNDKTIKSDVMFLWGEIDDQSIIDELGIRPDIDSVIYVPGAVLWSVDRANATRSGMQRLSSSPIYKQMTIRNVNTTRKIYELMLNASFSCTLFQWNTDSSVTPASRFPL